MTGRVRFKSDKTQKSAINSWLTSLSDQKNLAAKPSQPTPNIQYRKKNIADPKQSGREGSTEKDLGVEATLITGIYGRLVCLLAYALRMATPPLPPL